MWYSVYTDIQSFTELSNIDEPNALIALKLHHRIMRKLLVKHRGFETNTEGDSFMIEFSDLLDALSFCIDTQITHLHPKCAQEPDWPEALLTYPVTQEMFEQTGSKSIIYRGLRVRMVVSHADDQSTIHAFSGRRRVSHETDMRMRDLLKQTIGGQIIIPRETFSLLSSNVLDARFVELRAVSLLKHNGMPLVSMYPTKLQARMYRSNVQLIPILGPGHERHDKTGVLDPVTMAFVRFQLGGCITLDWCQEIINTVALDDMSMYQCEETYGVFVIAFNSPKKLLYFLKALFEKLQRTQTITQTGVSCGIPIHIETHAVTGKTCYYGDFMQKASRLCDACDPGYIYMAYSLYLSLQTFMEHLKCFVFVAHRTQTFKGLPRMKVTIIKYVPLTTAPMFLHGRRQSDPVGLSEFVKSFMDKSFLLPVTQIHNDVPDHYANDGYDIGVDSDCTYVSSDEIWKDAEWEDGTSGYLHPPTPLQPCKSRFSSS